jgi:hypothetical protein
MTDKRLVIRLAELRRALAMADGQEDGSFARLFNEFLDMTESTSLLDQCKPVKGGTMRPVLEMLIRKARGDDSIQLHALHALRYPASGFLHGGFFAGGMMGSFFYFEKDLQGLLALYRGGAMMDLARITMTALPPGSVFVPGPKEPQ